MTRLDWSLLTAVLAVALLVRGLYFGQVHSQMWFTQPLLDARNFDLWARSILAGDWLGRGPLVHSPLYPFFLAFLYLLTGARTAAAAGLQLLLGAATCVMVFLLGRRVFSRFTGTAAGLAQAVYGIGIFHEGTLLTVVLIHALNLGLLLAVYRAADRPRPWAWVLPGVLLGLSILARPNILLFGPVLAVWIWLRSPSVPKWRSSLAPIGTLLVCAFLVTVPVTVRNRVVLHEFMFTVGTGGPNFYMGNSARSAPYHRPIGKLGMGTADFQQTFKLEAEKALGRPLTYAQSSRYWTQQAWREIRNDPDHWQNLLMDKFLLFFNRYEYTNSLNYYAIREFTLFLRFPWLSFAVLGPLCLLGMVLAFRRWRELLPLYGLVAVVLATTLTLFVSSEYRYASLPAFFCFGAYALETLVLRVRRRQWHDLVLPAALLTLFGFLVNADVIGKEGRDYHLATAHSNFGNLLARQGEFRRAAEEFNMAKLCIPYLTEERAWLSYLEGDARMQDHDYDQALFPLEEAFGLTPNDPVIGNQYANALTALGYWEDALAIREHVLDLRPNLAEYRFNLGVTQLWAGKQALAEASFREALAADPELSAKLAEVRSEVRAAGPGKTRPPRERLRLPASPSPSGAPLPGDGVPAPVQPIPNQYLPPYQQPYQPPYQQPYQPPAPPIQYQPPPQQYQPPPPPPPIQYPH